MKIFTQALNIYNLNKTCNYFGIKYISRIHLDDNLYLLELIDDIFALVDSDSCQILMIKYESIGDASKYRLIFQAQNKSMTGIRSRNLFEIEMDAPTSNNSRDSMRILIVRTIMKVADICGNCAKENRNFLKCLSLCRWEHILKSKSYEISEVTI